MTYKINEAQEALNTAIDMLVGVEEGIVNLLVGQGTTGVSALKHKPLEKVDNYTIVYMPAFSLRGAKAERFRYIERLDGNPELLKARLLYATEEGAVERAQHIMDTSAREFA